MFAALIRRYFDEYERRDSALEAAGPAPVSAASLMPEEKQIDRDVAAAKAAVLKAAAQLRAHGEDDSAARLLSENERLIHRPLTGLASDEVEWILTECSRRSWTLLVELVDRAPEDALGYVAAGPLEVFFAQPGALAFLAQTREQVKTNERFRRALEQAWDLPPEIEALIDD